MSDSRAAPDLDRLPWLTNDRRGSTNADKHPVLLWAIFAAILVACISYWLGMKSISVEQAWTSADAPAEPGVATVRLPEAVEVQPLAPTVQLPAMPEVQPIAPPPLVRMQAERATRSTEPEAKSPRSTAEQESASATSGNQIDRQASAEPAPPLQAWPALLSAGADGRLVRIGSFSSRAQAKRGWRQIVRAYPGMTRLKAAVVPNASLRDGRTYYRLQFGTTSHAHSAVLCQRMRMIAQSCVAVGTPKVQERTGP